MLTKVKPLLSAFIVLMISVGAQATGVTRVITQAGTLSNDGQVCAILHLKSDLVTVPDCAVGYEHQVSFPLEDKLGESLYTTALAAVMSGNEVYISYGDSNCALWGSRVQATRIDIKSN